MRESPIIMEMPSQGSGTECRGGSSYRLWWRRRPPAPLPKVWHTLGGNIKQCINNCHRDPVNIFLMSMHNSLFRLLILFEIFDELQSID